MAHDLEERPPGRRHRLPRDLVQELVEHVWGGSGGEPVGSGDAVESLRGLRTAFPRSSATVMDSVGNDTLTVVRFEIAGAHEGSLFGIPPTGRSTSLTAIVVATGAEGRLTHVEVEYDVMGMLERLRILPSIETVPFAAIWTMSRLGRLRREHKSASGTPQAADVSAQGGNVALVHSVLEEVFNGRNPDAADAYLADDVVIHHPVYPSTVTGLEAFKELPRRLLEGFPDLRVTLEHVVGQNDRVGARWVIRGRHEGLYRRVPATGRRVTIPVQEILHVRDGRIVEMWFAINLLGVAQQLGVMPSLAALGRLRRARPRRSGRGA